MSRSSSAMGLLCGFLLLAFFGGCTEDVGTSVRISLVYKDSWRMSQADVIVIAERSEGQDAEDTLQLEHSGPISHELLVLVPDSLAGNVMPFEVWGVRDDERISHGSAVALVRKGETVEATIVLGRLPCGVFCELGEKKCQSSGVITCEEDADGCLQLSEPMDCPSELPFCTDGECGVSCENECAIGEGECVDATTSRSCGEFDNDACQDFGPQVKCTGTEVCYSGRCATPCTHAAALNNLSVPGSAGAFGPAVAVDAAGGVHAVYSEANTRALRYGFRTRNGAWPATWDLTGAVGENPTIAVDKAGGVHVMGGGASLVYAYRPPASTVWQTSGALDDASSILAPALAIGSDGVVHAVYHRTTDTLTRYGTRTGDTTWTFETAGDADTGLRCDLTMIGTTPHISGLSTINDLYYVTKADGAWTTFRVARPSSTSVSATTGTTIAAEREGTLHIVYSDFTATRNWIQEVAKPAGGSWTTPRIVDDLSAGSYPDLAIDPFDRLHVAYRGVATPALRYATRDKDGAWSLAAQPPNTPGVTPSIAIDALGNVRILSASTSVIETTRSCQ